MGAVQQEAEKVRGDDEDDETREGSSPGSDRVLRRGRRGRDLSRFLLPVLSDLPSHTHKHTHSLAHTYPHRLLPIIRYADWGPVHLKLSVTADGQLTGPFIRDYRS